MSKKRIHEIAKEQGVPSKTLLERLRAGGLEVKTAASSVEESLALRALGLDGSGESASSAVLPAPSATASATATPRATASARPQPRRRAAAPQATQAPPGSPPPRRPLATATATAPPPEYSRPAGGRAEYS